MTSISMSRATVVQHAEEGRCWRRTRDILQQYMQPTETSSIDVCAALLHMVSGPHLRTSIMASLCPRQSRGPLLKGINVCALVCLSPLSSCPPVDFLPADSEPDVLIRAAG